MGRKLFFLVCVIIFGTSCKKNKLSSPDIPVAVTSFKAIYKGLNHCAFTDLIKWKSNYYLTFRSSDKHIDGLDGEIIVLTSPNGDNWSLLQKYDLDGYDLRDPKFLISPAGNLLVNTEGFSHSSPKKRVNVVYTVSLSDVSKPILGGLSGLDYDVISDNTSSYVGPKDRDDADDYLNKMIKIDVTYWPWRFTEYNGKYYSWSYTANTKDFKLIETENFNQHRTVCTPNLLNSPTESTIRFANDSIYSLLRKPGNALLGRASVNNLCKEKWLELQIVNFGGPNFIFFNNHQILMCGREELNGGALAYTTVYLYDLLKNKITYKMRLPSGGDTSYPGLLLEGRQLWVSYYSSHEDGKAEIYFVKIDLDKFFSSENAVTYP